MQVHVSQKHKVIGVPAREDVRNLFPSAKQILMGGANTVVVPHLPAETFLLRKLGFEIPAPINSHYDYRGGSPFEVQRKTCAMLTMNQRAYVLSGMGTGKTKTALWSWDYLRTHGCAKKALVVAPLSTLKFTWAREVFTTLPGVRCAVLHGTKEKRLQMLADPEAQIFVINHDGLKVIADEIAKRSDIDTLIIDELAVYRNGQSQRTKMTRELAKRMNWVWGMTGSPIPNCPTDAWAQASIITPHTIPRYFNRFREELLHRITQFKWSPKPDAVEKAFAAMQPAVRFTLDDVTELPECIERTLDIELGPKQERIYKSLVEHAFAAVQAKEITAANAGAVMMKLLQVSTGWVYSSDGGVVPLDNDKRIEALVDAINSTDRKVLVFVPFKHALKGISDALTSEGIEHAVVSGDTPANERAQVFNLFQNTGKYRVIAAHPQCLAHGITLTAADTVIWFAPVTSLEIFDQANHRIRRVGQHHKQQVVMMQATPVEKKIYALLSKKARVQDKLLELFEDASKEDQA
jgi:SNF2 family DNA or RNA helicase